MTPCSTGGFSDFLLCEKGKQTTWRSGSRQLSRTLLSTHIAVPLRHKIPRGRPDHDDASPKPSTKSNPQAHPQ